mgnify:CR=1 FL=1
MILSETVEAREAALNELIPLHQLLREVVVEMGTGSVNNEVQTHNNLPQQNVKL